MAKKIQESLVTDQPGRKVVFAGILISLLLGFFIRGMTQPEFLQVELKRAVSKLHTSTQVSWGRAEISLKNGLLPRFSVLLQDVKIVSDESCWGQPLLYAREMEFPISFVSFFERGQPLQKVFVRDAFLELKSQIKCEKENNLTEKKTEEKKALVVLDDKPQAIKLRPLKESQKAPPLVLTHFIFENLKLRQTEWVFPDWAFRTLELNVKENNPWYAELKSDFKIPDMEGVDTGAQLNVVYKEFPSRMLEASVKGHWREGTIQLNGLWEGDEKGWTFKSQFNHIPFQFLKSMAARTKTPWNWPEKPMWFSFNTQSVIPFKKWESGQHFVRQLQVEGDLGDLLIADLEIQSLRPFKVRPFAFSVHEADLSAAFQENLKKIAFLSSLGKLSGQGQWSSEKDVLFTGKVERIEVPLFHRDQKLQQVVKSVDLQAELKSGQWKMSAQNWQLEKGALDGSVRLESNQDMSQGQLQMNLEDFHASPEMLKMVEVITPDVHVKGKLQSRWKNSVVQDMTAQLRSDLIETRTMKFDKPFANWKKSGAQWEFKIQSPTAELRELPAGVEIAGEAPRLAFPFVTKNWISTFQSENPAQVRWNINSSVIKSSGLNAVEGALRGTLQLGADSFEVMGSRQSPRLMKK